MPARRIRDEYELRRKMEMKRNGLTQADLAKDWNTSQPFVSRLLSGDSRSRQHEEGLARRLNMAVDKLFPRRPSGEVTIAGQEYQQATAKVLSPLK